MPAESYTELFNFEGNIESAFKKWLGDQMLEARAQLEVETLPDDYIGVKMNLGGITWHYNTSPGGATAPTPDQYDFTLEFTVQTRRHNEEGSQTANVASRHREIVALVRTWVNILKIKQSNLSTYLQHYQIEFLNPAGTEQSIDDVFDISTLSHDGNFSIKASAFPIV